MQKIVHQLGLTKGVTININIYGYGSKSKKANPLMSDHLKVYEDIVNIVTMENANKRKQYVSQLNTNKLRDIKSKMGSKGKTGKKQEMVNGIIKELPKLIENYHNNNQSDTDDEQSENCDIDIKDDNESVSKSNNNDKQECDADDVAEKNDDDIEIEIDANKENDVDDGDEESDNDIDLDIKENNVSDADDENESEDEATDVGTTKTTTGFKRRRRSKRIRQYESDSDSESQIDSDSEYIQPSYTDSDRLQEYFRKQSLKNNKNKNKNFKRKNNKSKRNRKQSLNDKTKTKNHKTKIAEKRLKQPQHFEYNDDDDICNEDEEKVEEKVENFIQTIALCGSTGQSDLIKSNIQNLSSGDTDPAVYTDDSFSAPDSAGMNYTDLSEGDQSHNEQAEDADQLHDEKEEEEEEEDDKKDWETVAIGWDNIVKYIQSHPTTWWEIWKYVSKQDVDNYLGKDWEWRQSYSYIKRLAFELENFSLMIYKKNPYITKWVNVKSKWRSSKKYIVLLSWYQVHIHDQSYRKMTDETIFIPPDELHWYNWLKQKEKIHPVSYYLHKKHQNRQKKLEERRVKRLIRKNKYMYKGDNIGRMCKQDLLFYAKERNIKIPQNIKTIGKQRKYILKTLRERDVNKWEENQMCFKCKTKKAMKEHKCMKCNGAFYCSEKCRKSHWSIEHENKCSQLYAAVCRENVIDKTKIFPSLKEIAELKKQCENDNNDSNPPPPSYLQNYPSQKSWFDLKFELFDSQLDRLQQRCSCRSGVQLPGVCAHAGCIIRLVYHVLKLGTVDQLLKINRRDRLIKQMIVNLHPFSEELKANKEKYKYLCLHCSSPVNKENTEEYIKCNHCFRYYHLLCINQKSIHDYSKYIQTIWHCPNCDYQHVWCVRNS